MQAVFSAPSETAGSLASGLLESIIRASLILFLRLVDAGPHQDLSPTGPQLELPQLEIARPRRPPKYIRDAVPFLLAEHQHWPLGSILSSRPPHPLLPSLRHDAPNS